VSVSYRICFLDQSGELGGAELCLADLAEFARQRSTVVLFGEGPFAQVLRERGVDARVVPLPGSAAGVSKSSGPLSYFRAALGLIPFLWRAGRIARGHDLLYANTMKALVVAAGLSFWLRKPFCFHLHDVLNASHFSAVNRRLAVFLADRAALVVANSRASAEAYRAAGGRNPRVHVLYNGFCLERFSPVSPESAREALPVLLRGNSPLVGLFGRVTPWKGQHVLIEALAFLPGVHALIVGDALFTDEDRRYRQELEALAERLGVRGRVHFTGFQPDIRPLVCAVDAVVHCSVAPEPFGRVVVEAMLLGRPLVAAGAGGVLELVHEGRTGLLTEPADAPALARAIRSLLENPDRARALGQAAREEARDRFGLKGILSRWNAWIEGLATGAGTGPVQEELRCA
jgi:glycosyltransferase involved in cell wall biosynthesis